MYVFDHDANTSDTRFELLRSAPEMLAPIFDLVRLMNVDTFAIRWAALALVVGHRYLQDVGDPIIGSLGVP